jgi:hypothetical protein
MFDTKIAIVIREDLMVWQKLNVTARRSRGGPFIRRPAPVALKHGSPRFARDDGFSMGCKYFPHPELVEGQARGKRRRVCPDPSTVLRACESFLVWPVF